MTTKDGETPALGGRPPDEPARAGGANAADAVKRGGAAAKDQSVRRDAAGPGRSPPAAPGRALAAFALLVAALALAGAGYLFVILVYQPDPLAARLAALEQRFAQLQTHPGRPASADSELLRRELERVAAELRADLQAELAQRPGPAAVVPQDSDQGVAQPPAVRDWQIAEVRYLLRMANHRLLLERDISGAATLLRAADDVLAAIGDFALHDVRARIAAEILALESVPAVDAEGLFLQLEAIKRDVDRLPLRLPELRPAPPAEQQPAGWLDAIWGEIARLVRFRQFDGAVRPLLAPEEAVYLELNLRLMLERAQLAGLRREQEIYDQSIAVAIDWMEQYLDGTAPEVQRVLEGLRVLQGMRLARALPDISGSLSTLEAVAAAPRPGP